jgi:hypothetical protein
MLKQTLASLAPVALIVVATACGGASSSTTEEDEQGTPQASGADTTGDGVADEQVERSESEIRRGGAVRGGAVVGGRGVVAGGRGVVAGGRGVVVGRRGWVGGRWAPGWGWVNGQWIAGGAGQYTCVTDLDCVGPLGPNVAVCSYDPALALGYCIAPNW